MIVAGAIASALPLRAGLLFYAVSNDMISGNNQILKFNADGSHAPWDITWDSNVKLANAGCRISLVNGKTDHAGRKSGQRISCGESGPIRRTF